MFQPPERRENSSTLPVLNQQAENIENHNTDEGILRLSQNISDQQNQIGQETMIQLSTKNKSLEEKLKIADILVQNLKQEKENLQYEKKIY